MNGKEKDDKWYRGIIGLISFSTIIPINIYCELDETGKYTWIWPFIGALFGLLATVLAYILLKFLPVLLLAVISYSFMIGINGFHHLDGLIDFGDVLMAHGTAERKIEILKDPMIGTGGIALFFIVATMTIASIYPLLAKYILAILICEISAKLGIVTCASFSKSMKTGTGKYFIDNMTKLKFLFSLILSAILGYLILNYIGLIGIIGGALGGFLMSRLAMKHLNVANGDVLGASNEIGRLFSLIMMLIAISV